MEEIEFAMLNYKLSNQIVLYSKNQLAFAMGILPKEHHKYTLDQLIDQWHQENKNHPEKLRKMVGTSWKK